MYLAILALPITLVSLQECYALQNTSSEDYNPSTGILGMIKVRNYNKYERPLDGGLPDNITICPYFNTLDINDRDMEITVSVYLSMEWYDTRLKNNGKVRSVSPASESKIWIPDIYVVEDRSDFMLLQSKTDSIAKVEPSGLVRCKIKGTVNAACTMKLQEFPHDRHVCNVSFSSFGHSAQDILLELKVRNCLIAKHEKLVRAAGFALNGEIKTSLQRKNHENGNFSIVQISFYFVRKRAIYFLQIYVPTTLSVVLSWLSFWIHHEAVAARIALGITTVLTVSTLVSTTQASLPPVPYSKEIDWFLCICFAYVVAALVEFVTVHYCVTSGWCRSSRKTMENSYAVETYEDEQEEDTTTADSFTNQTFSDDLEMSEQQVTSEIVDLKRPSSRKAKQKKRNKKTSRRYKLYSRIDVWSRLFFPATFLIFYVLYWNGSLLKMT